MKVLQIVNKLFESNTYILYDDNCVECYLIDCGDTEPIFSWIAENHKKIEAVFVTHTHFDHIYGLNDFKQHFPLLKIYTSHYGMKALFSDKLNLLRYHEMSSTYMFREDIIELKEENVVKLFPTVSLATIETPSHDCSCLTYVVENNLFTGDSYIPGLKVIISFPCSDCAESQKSSKRIEKLMSRYNLYSGHGAFIINKLS